MHPFTHQEHYDNDRFIRKCVDEGSTDLIVSRSGKFNRRFIKALSRKIYSRKEYLNPMRISKS